MDISKAISEIEQIAAENGVVPGQVCSNATGNFRLYERMKRQAEKYSADMELIRAHYSSPKASRIGRRGKREPLLTGAE